MGGRGPFRFWFYIRQGWSTYFAFAIGMINTVTLTYYLAVENYPALNDVFPSFAQYALVVVAASIPLVALMGYVHYKKSPSYRSDVDIMMESNPYALRMKTNSETTLGLTLEVLSPKACLPRSPLCPRACSKDACFWRGRRETPCSWGKVSRGSRFRGPFFSLSLCRRARLPRFPWSPGLSL